MGRGTYMRAAAVRVWLCVFSARHSASFTVLTARCPTCPPPAAALPRSYYYKRGQYPLKKISEWAAKRGFTHLLVLSERLKTPNG